MKIRVRYGSRATFPEVNTISSEVQTLLEQTKIELLTKRQEISNVILGSILIKIRQIEMF